MFWLIVGIGIIIFLALLVVEALQKDKSGLDDDNQYIDWGEKEDKNK